MSEQVADFPAQKRAPVFRGSLVRTFLISLGLIALIPASIIGITSYFRYRSLLETQLNTQLSSLSQLNTLQISQLIAGNQLSLQNLTTAAEITSAFAEYPTHPDVFQNDYNLNSFLTTTIGTLTTNGLVGIYALNVEGKVIMASDFTRVGDYVNTDPWLSSLIGTSTSTLVVNPGKLYPNQLMLVTSYTKQMTGVAGPLTFFFFSKSPLFTTLLQNPLSYYPDANVFFVTSDKRVVTYNPSMLAAQSLNLTANQLADLNGRLTQSGNGKVFTYTNYQNKAVYAYIKPISQIKSYFVIEIPLTSATGQLQTFLNFIYLALAATLLLSVVIAFLGARQMAVPLVDLSDRAQKFAGGDFNQKANISRGDEIGRLAYSFNNMVDQLSTFYGSLEARVAERTEQLRTATEIAQEAVSASTTNAILQRVTASIVERLNAAYAAVYLLDQSSQNLVLSEDHGRENAILPERSLSLPVDNTSLVGWTAANRQARLSQNVLAERPRLLTTPLLATTQSEIALPITIAERLIGVLDIQSEQANAFDFESLPAFTTLTNQISTGLRNLELLESTQLNLQETAALYTATRQITQAQSADEVMQQITALFTQTAYASFFFDVDSENLRLVSLADAKSTPADVSLLGSVLPFANGLQHLQANGAEIIDNFQRISDFSALNAYFARRGCQSDAIIPVFEGKQLRHVLAIGSRADAPLTPLQAQPYINLSEAIGTSLERIHLSNSLDLKQKEIGVLSALSAISISETSLEGFYETTHQQLRSLFGDTLGLCAALLDDEQTHFSILYCALEEPITVPSYAVGNDLLSQVAQTGENILPEETAASGALLINAPEVHLSARSCLAVPMFSAGKQIGVLALFSSEQALSFGEDAPAVVSLVASRLASTLVDREQKENLHRLSETYAYEKSLFDALLENIPDRISFKNRSNEFIRLSKSLAEFLGSSAPTELIGKSDEYHYSAEGEANDSSVADLISSQTPLLNQFEKWQDRNGDPAWVVSNKIPLVDEEGSVTGLLSIASDVTDLIEIRQLAERRAEQLLTASEIARDATAGTMDIEITLSRLVDLIKTRFNFYQASIFLIDALGKNAVLRESTGEAGEQMKQAGHKLAVGSTSIVGQATGTGQPVVIGDVTQEINYFANPLLPDTHSELAIPMKIGDRVLGALDVQSTEFNAFSPEDIAILQVLADQTAVAVENEELFTQTNRSLSRHRLLHILTEANVENMTAEDSIRSALEVLHQAMPEESITYFAADQVDALTARAYAGLRNPDQTSRRIPVGRGLIGRVASERQAIRVDAAQTDSANQPQDFESNSILAVPVTFAETLLGVINIESTALAKFDENDLEFVATLAGNLGSIISNVRLVEQVREQVDRQQKLFEITNKIRRSVDLETIMQTSVTEIANALNVRRATIQISPRFEGDQKKEEK